ncbi:helix-turn-helix domain-containing protein [Modestobacter versicolor]|uniref:Transcriptional regulator n=1 Tax=Modestobacter versicolor TaxID=429133 RepID=A0A323VBZ8_9ACTN|nr:helix-turn-helix transcriptional regulator [Modestobacter versicolor]MBB3675158.1 transcriptional regulator with XRE-family HTH domain [Modestobacter versicolor]PZA21720.1 transcriptional regulator [Modestobacter versicolor]
MSSGELGAFLRAHRALVTPAQVALAPGHGRRVPGLRREEVALLAGVSVDYYVRLEQGRERHPSVQVLDALSGVLLLDDDARLHLYRLADVAPLPAVDTSPERVDPDLLRLMEAWPDNPALVLGRSYDVLAGNRLGAALFAPLTHSGNLLLNVFLDPAARTFYADWSRAAVNTVAGFRLQHGARPGDPRARHLVRHLTQQSPDFARIWARQEARGKSAEEKTFLHPGVGRVTLRMQTLDVRSAPGQQLVVYLAEPGSSDSDALRLLGSLAAERDQAQELPEH